MRDEDGIPSITMNKKIHCCTEDIRRLTTTQPHQLRKTSGALFKSRQRHRVLTPSPSEPSTSSAIWRRYRHIAYPKLEEDSKLPTAYTILRDRRDPAYLQNTDLASAVIQALCEESATNDTRFLRNRAPRLNMYATTTRSDDSTLYTTHTGSFPARLLLFLREQHLHMVVPRASPEKAGGMGFELRIARGRRNDAVPDLDRRLYRRISS